MYIIIRYVYLECIELQLLNKTIPAQRDVLSYGKGQCLSGAEEVPRVKPEHFRGMTKALAFPKGYNRIYIPLGRD